MNKSLLGIIKSSQEKSKSYEDIITGYFNSYKFKVDLQNLIKENKHKNISIVLLSFENMDMIKRYVEYEVSINAFVELHEKAQEFFHKGTIYTIPNNRIAVLMPDVKIPEASSSLKSFILNTKEPIQIEGLPISITLRGGIVHFPSHSTDDDELMMMMDKALEQGRKTGNITQIYNNIIDKEQELYFRDLVSLYNALKNNMFTLAYQPIIDVQKNKISSVEALLRWNEMNDTYMSISDLIKRAEDAGFINEITRWLFDSVAEQLNKWNEKKMEIAVSMNLSSKDILDDSFIDYVKSYIEENNLNPKFIEFELNERTIVQDEKIASDQLKRLKSTGARLSLDDYGSGCNSIKNLMDLAGKFDYLKIDKVFIDKILKNEKLIMVDCIIKAAHRLGMKVVAEGVEIQEQYEILKTVDCDMIQGHYYSKPMTPEEFEKYYLNFQMKQ